MIETDKRPIYFQLEALFSKGLNGPFLRMTSALFKNDDFKRESDLRYLWIESIQNKQAEGWNLIREDKIEVL